MSDILLLGGGYVLSRLAKHLPEKTFVITSRSAEKVKAYQAQGYFSLQVDLQDLSPLNEFQFTQVVYSIPPASLADLKNVCQYFSQQNLARFIYLSTTGVYGGKNGEIVDEQSQTLPFTEKGKARLEAENIFKALGASLNILRLPAIWGPGRSPIDSLRAGRYPYVDSGSRYSNRIHVDDLNQVILKILQSKESIPQILNVSDGQSIKTSELIAELCKQHNLPFPKSISQEEAQKRGMQTLLGNQRVSNKLLLATFGDIIKNDVLNAA